MSVEEMLAAARGEKAGGSAATAEAPAAETAPEKDAIRGELESARRPKESGSKGSAPQASAAPAGGGKPAKLERKSMSVEEMLAAARAEKNPGAAAPVAEAPAVPEADEPETAAPEAEAPAAEEPAAEAPAAATGEVVSKRDEITAVADQVAYCRQVDR